MIVGKERDASPWWNTGGEEIFNILSLAVWASTTMLLQLPATRNGKRGRDKLSQ
jgi:hypothetical protein